MSDNEDKGKYPDTAAQAIFDKQLKMALDPKMLELVAIVTGTAGYTLSESKRKCFKKFHAYITNPQPKFITNWRESKETEKHYHYLVGGVLTNTQNVYMAVNYHFEKIVNIEKAVIQNLEKQNYKDILGDSCAAFGNSLALDFEFQAFIVAYKQCLDLLTRAMGAFFRQNAHRFKTLPESFAKYKPNSVAAALIKVHEKYAKDFKFVLSEGAEKSIRDLMAHYKFVSAGTINISKFGFKFAGINEQLFDSHEANDPISMILERKVNLLGSCIEDMLSAFEKEVRVWDKISAVACATRVE